MPDKEFLETYPLYRKLKVQGLPSTLNLIRKVPINMACPTCRSAQAFLMTSEYFHGFEYSNYSVEGTVFRASYKCTHCQKFERIFFLQIDKDKTSITKVGQSPPWEIETEPLIEKLLGRYSGHYKKGLVCESQGYGIGAFGYYRRIVEVVIDSLLDDVGLLMTGQEAEQFSHALLKTKATTVTQEKIDLVKDLLPPILRPDGLNPLGVLHSALSEGLHAETDDSCLEQAAVIREVLVFLVRQLESNRASAKAFTAGMRKLLEKKVGKSV